MLGDWGISGYNQAYVAKAMGSWANTYSPSFVIALGDNFYTNGVQSTSDSQWSGSWSSVYLGYSGLNVPWYPVLVSEYAGALRRTLVWALLCAPLSSHFPARAYLCPPVPCGPASAPDSAYAPSHAPTRARAC